MPYTHNRAKTRKEAITNNDNKEEDNRGLLQLPAATRYTS